jgi:hypothetical protein
MTRNARPAVSLSSTSFVTCLFANFLRATLAMRSSPSRHLRVLTFMLAALPVLASANRPAAPGPADPAPAIATMAEVRVGSVARLLAGLPPTAASHAAIAESTEWQAHRDQVQAGWAKVKAGRGEVMSKWRDGAIRSGCAGSGTLLYPFSGPDFMNAHVLFPGCRSYILFGLELPGEVPELDRLDRAALGRLLADVRVAVGDLVERNYFITSRMSRQLHTSQLKGVVPVLIASMALAGMEVKSVEPLELPALPRAEEEGAEIQGTAAKPWRTLRAVQITFQRPGGKPQTLQYFSVDATNKGIAPYPEFLAHLRSARPAPMLIKSASYLLQDRQFRMVRDTLLETAEFLVQDDTGMPYAVLKEHGWDVNLYGGYRKPIRPFHWAYQSKLDAAYKTGASGELPFSFSYHWNGGKSNAMVARRLSVQAAAPTAGFGTPVPGAAR